MQTLITLRCTKRTITSCIAVKVKNKSNASSSRFFLFVLLGVKFDFFGIGEFWGCKSVQNDFGLQFRFYYYERASLIGGVALKAGKSIVSVMTRKTENTQDTPILRCVSLNTHATNVTSFQDFCLFSCYLLYLFICLFCCTIN